jgi:SAM-dependent MidA family methyltransferase
VSVVAEILKEIRMNGPMTFDQFMHLALYSDNGYYNTQREVGKKGDFYTSVSVGPLFGELLARQFAEWLKPLEKCEIVEVGAHDAKLARDILNWLSLHEPGLFARLQYIIVEPSEQRSAWQRETLHSFGNRLMWIHVVPPKIRGIVFSNELLDAMPVHRIFWDAPRRQWMEWCVASENEKLFWVRRELSAECRSLIPQLSNDLLDVLPNKFTTEVSPTAVDWWSDAARKLEQGRIVAFDYGLTEQEFFRPDRANGTARAYYKHHLVDDFLANPGEQDLTAHVNWTAIQRAGEEAGLRTETFCSQEEFLMRVVSQAAAENWNAEQIRQLKTLTHPNFLGRAFRVLVQSRGDCH